MYQGIVTAKALKEDRLMLAALTAPLYWMLMSLAAMKALWQLITQPSHWEKTEHGLYEGQLVGPGEQ